VWRWYVDGRPREDATYDEATTHARAGLGYLWVGLHDPDEATMAGLTARFGLHELAAEDVIEGHRRSKLEQFDDDLFMVVSTVDYVEHDKLSESSEIVSTGEIMIFLGSWYVITARKRGRALIKSLRADFEGEPDEVAMGPWRVLYRVLDLVIDDFRELADHLQATRESITAMDDILTTYLQAALAQASFADNQDMRKISAAVAILAIPTTLGAIYGMNFDNMPELHTQHGYFVVLGLMLAGMVLAFLLFRRFRWL
jgi:Mg2+ and Co2+ transporter CorA